HILGICGTFMGGVAALAREAGHQVTGCDANVYPPMSDQLRALGIELIEGYGREQVAIRPDLYVVGNVVTRGNPLVEAILDEGLPYASGPQWLAEHVLQGRHVLAVAGTHGTTTTTAMLAWVLEQGGLKPGFLVGGVPMNFGVSARLGEGAPFVIEADEYDTAFFDKRSKFVHYRPRTAVLNNLEFDHADIFDDLAAIERQFHHLVRTVPASGRLVVNAREEALQRVLAMGCWSEVVRFGARKEAPGELRARGEPHAFDVLRGSLRIARVEWSLLGEHNQMNALAAIAAAEHVGVAPGVARRGRPGLLPQRRPRLGRAAGARADGRAGRRVRHGGQAGRSRGGRSQARGSRALHEQWRLRRHPREAARQARQARLTLAAGGHDGSADPSALPARLPVVAAIHQGAPDGRLARRAPARRALVVPAAAGVAARGHRAGLGRHRRLAARTDGGGRQLARRLLCHGGGRARGLPGRAAEPRRRAGTRPGRPHRRDDRVAQRRPLLLPARVHRRAGRIAAACHHAARALLRRHREGRRGARLARDDGTLRR